MESADCTLSRTRLLPARAPRRPHFFRRRIDRHRSRRLTAKKRLPWEGKVISGITRVPRDYTDASRYGYIVPFADARKLSRVGIGRKYAARPGRWTLRRIAEV